MRHDRLTGARADDWPVMQEATHVFALRHGQTAWNADMRIQGQLDVPLNDTGRWQAAQLARALAGQGIAAVYSSDLQRAWHTAQALADASGAPLAAEPLLRERGFGNFEGSTYAEIAAQWPQQAQQWSRREPDFAPGGGESLRVFYARCVAPVLALAARHAGQTIAIVAHGGVLDCLYRAAVGVELQAPRSWQLGNAVINRLLWTPQGLALVGWNDAAHLEAAIDAVPAVDA